MHLNCRINIFIFTMGTRVCTDKNLKPRITFFRCIFALRLVCIFEIYGALNSGSSQQQQEHLDHLNCWGLLLTASAWFFWQWSFSLSLRANDLPHNVQLYDFSPAWNLLWWLRSPFRTKNLPHWEQLNILVSSGSTTSVCLYWRW
jgi:hypothetical protein